MTNHQCLGSPSNSHSGFKFEEAARAYFQRVENLELEPSLSIEIGVRGAKPKPYRFDLGSHSLAVLVECKSHTWTATGNIPSAKLTVWNEAMYYFHLVPHECRKVLFVQESQCGKRAKSLPQYYVETHGHLIPPDVSVFECNPEIKEGRYIRMAE